MKSTKILLLYWLLIVGLSSCKTPIDNVTGAYMSVIQNTKPYYGLNLYAAHKFVFNADSTFNYSYIVIGDAEKYSSGTWKQIDKNTIVLNSNVQSNIIPLNVEIVPSDNKNPMINFKLIVPGKEEKEYRATPQYAMIEDKLYVPNFDPDRGSYSYEITNYYSNNHELFFKVSKEPRIVERIGTRPYKEYYILETEHKKITTNDGDIINVTVIVPDSLFSYRVFNTEKIKVDGKNLIFKDKEDNNKTNKLRIR